MPTLPVVTPAGSVIVQVDLSAAEMSGDKIVVVGKDAAGDEWSDVMVFVDAPEFNAGDIFDAFFNDATTVVQGDGSRILTLFEDDGTTTKGQAQVAKDGNTRTKLFPTP